MKTRDYASKIIELCDGNVSLAARQMGVSRRTLYTWTDDKKPVIFSDEHAIKAADLLGLDHREVMLTIELERTSCPEARAVWSDLLQRISRHAAAAAVAFPVAYIALSMLGDAGQMSIMLSSIEPAQAAPAGLLPLGLLPFLRGSLSIRR